MAVYIDTRWLEPDAKPAALRRHDEETLHRAVWRYLQWALPADACAYHPANGGKRHPKAAARMAGLGVVPGVPDLAIVWQGRAIYIELKAGKGTLSDAQRGMHRKLVYCGAEVITCRSLECVETSLRELGVPLQATVSGWMGERLA
jgi:hypothetical protein